jgi:hypothetical protein
MLVSSGVVIALWSLLVFEDDLADIRISNQHEVKLREDIHFEVR